MTIYLRGNFIKRLLKRLFKNILLAYKTLKQTLMIRNYKSWSHNARKDADKNSIYDELSMGKKLLNEGGS